MPKRVLGCVLAFAAGALISALAIELAYQSAQELLDLVGRQVAQEIAS